MSVLIPLYAMCMQLASIHQDHSNAAAAKATQGMDSYVQVRFNGVEWDGVVCYLYQLKKYAVYWKYIFLKN